MTEPNYYELLGVAPTATEAEIKSAFRQEAKRNHPDQGGNPALFRLVEDAYNALSDPARRAAYDRNHGYAQTMTYTTDDFTYQTEEHPTSQWTDADWNDRSWKGDEATEWNGREPAAAAAQTSRFHESLWDRFRYAVEDASDWVGPWMFIAAFVWLCVAIGFGWSAVPGVENWTVIKVALVVLFIWAFGPVLLRLAGIVVAILALWNAQQNDAAGYDTALLLIGAGAMWILGHWLFMFKNGYPKSIVAFGLFNALKRPFEANWRWSRMRRY